MNNGCFEKVVEVLENEGWRYEKQGENLYLTMAYNQRKWKCVINVGEQGHVSCFGFFPWKIEDTKYNDVLLELNHMNSRQRRGSFFLDTSKGDIAYRCSIKLIDEFSEDDYITDCINLSIAAVDNAWDKIYRLHMLR